MFSAHQITLAVAVIHVTFTGRHIKPFLGHESTGEPVSWTSIEVTGSRTRRSLSVGVQADTAGLLAQLGGVVV
jgi:hypothetical protein